MEFDFQSYFNNVTWKSVELALDRLSMSRLSALVQMYLKNIRTRFRDVYCVEQEMLELGGGPKLDKKTNTYKPVYLRKGMPQGSPVSPILATLACDMTNPPKGLTMYADDGIFVGEDLSVFEEWLKNGESSGRLVDHAKTRELDSQGEFKFCGYKINFSAGYIVNEQGDTSDLFIPKEELLEFLKKGSHYTKTEKKRWEWDVDYNSYATRTKIDIFKTGWKTPLIWFFGAFRLEYMGFKWIPFVGIYSVTTTSSESVQILLNEVKKIKNNKELKRIKPLKLIYNWKDDIVKAPKNMRTHYEFNQARYSAGIKHLIPQMSDWDMMLSSRSFIGSSNYVKVSVSDYESRKEELMLNKLGGKPKE